MPLQSSIKQIKLLQGTLKYNECFKVTGIESKYSAKLGGKCQIE